MACLLLFVSAQAASAFTGKSAQKSAAKSKSKISKKNAHGKRVSSRSRKGAWKKKGQKNIADDRTREIQAALIRDGYLDGEPTGSMDSRTKAALVRLQKESGWQTKIVPDARALIKLGLGPNHDNLLNPDTAAYATPVVISPAGKQ